MRVWKVFSERPPLFRVELHPPAPDDCSTVLKGERGVSEQQCVVGPSCCPPYPPDGEAPCVVDQGTQRPLQTVAVELLCRDQLGVVARKLQPVMESDRHPCRLETLCPVKTSKGV